MNTVTTTHRFLDHMVWNPTVSSDKVSLRTIGSAAPFRPVQRADRRRATSLSGANRAVTRGTRPGRSGAMTAADALRRAADLYHAGDESMEQIFAPDCEIGGNPGAVRPPAHGATFDQKVDASDAQGVGYLLRDILEDRGDRALFSGVWTHDAPDDPGQGSAGLFFGICTVAGDLIVRMDLFPTEDEARAALAAG